jgi:hypothetical protein
VTQEDHGHVPSLLPAIRDVTLVAGICLFFAGFIFHYYYFVGLGVPPDTQSMDFNSLVVRSSTVFAEDWYWYLGAIVVVALITSKNRRRWKTQSLWQHRAVVAVAVVLFFGLIYGTSIDAGHKMACSVRRGEALRPVILSLIRPSVYDPTYFVSAVNGTLSSAHAYLVAETASDYFILIEPDSGSKCKDQLGQTYRVPRSAEDHYRENV